MPLTYLPTAIAVGTELVTTLAEAASGLAVMFLSTKHAFLYERPTPGRLPSTVAA